MSSIYKALSEAKKQILPLTKESSNPFFNSKYFDINSLLANVEPILNSFGLMVLQPIKNGSVVTEIVHVESGEIVSSSIELPQQNDPQKLGSAITYYRRYTLASLLSLQAEDDDANKASKPAEAKKGSKNEPERWLNISDPEWKSALGKVSSVSDLRKYFKVSKANAAEYEKQLKEINNLK